MSETPAELRLKVLQLAREILHNQYVEVKARIHNEWSLRADIAWKSVQRVPPYPQLPEYFTEQHVLERAHPLWQFVQHAPESTESMAYSQSPAYPIPEPSAQIADTAPEDVQPESTVSDQTPEVTITEPEATPEPEPIVAESPSVPLTPEPQPAQLAPSTPKGLKVLPAWLTARRS